MSRSEDSEGLVATGPDGNVTVVIRVRPPLSRELGVEKHYSDAVRISPGGREITIVDVPSFGYAGSTASSLARMDSDRSDGDATPSTEHASSDTQFLQRHVFTFDRVYGPDSSQQAVYETTAKAAVLSVLEGYNATVIAYGQTGTGKTYTMEGSFDAERDGMNTERFERGVIPRAMQEVFRFVHDCNDQEKHFLVRASYLQIYCESISDLLAADRTNLLIREGKKGLFVEGLSEWVVRSPAEIYSLIERGQQVRATASHKMNEVSSRSHAVFTITVEQSENIYMALDGEIVSPEIARRANGQYEKKSKFKVGKLNLVDLAGSERVRLTGATGQRLEESKNINQSLSALGNVVAALIDVKRPHIPYRNSKLTRLLEDSLGGNCKTTMMAMISPAAEAFQESLSTLKFANRCKQVKNEARVNVDLDEKALLRKYEKELIKLRAELEEKNRSVNVTADVIRVKEEQRRAEAEKEEVSRELLQTIQRLDREKAEKQQLEDRIKTMQENLLVGGMEIKEMPAFRTALQNERQRITMEYESQLSKLEQERRLISEDKAQVDKYKELLLKQRDVMIALTACLNERDQTILALQEEVDAFDRHQRMMEDILDQKTAELIHLERVVLQQDYDAQHVKTSGGDKNGGKAGAIPLHLKASASSVVVDEEGRRAKERRLAELEGRANREEAVILALTTELEQIQAEKVSLEYLLREKLEQMVQSEIEERIASYCKELEHWKASVAASEERRRQAEYVLSLAKLQIDSPEFSDLVHRIVRQEADIRNAPIKEEIARIKAETQRKEEELSFALKRRHDLAGHSPLPSPSYGSVSGGGAGDAEMVAALRQRLRSANEDIREMQRLEADMDTSRQGSHRNASSSASTIASAAPSEGAVTEQRLFMIEEALAKLRAENSVLEKQGGGGAAPDLSVTIANLEASLHRTDSEVATMCESYESKLSQVKAEMEQVSLTRARYLREAEAETLRYRRQLENDDKERQAIRTIMEVKIKSLVDNIAALSSSRDSPDLLHDVLALQKLINASVAALK